MNNILVKTVLAILLSVLAPGVALAAEELPAYELSVSFDIESNLLRGDAAISLPREGTWNVIIGGLRVLSANLDGKPVSPGSLSGLGGGRLEIHYEKAFRPGDVKTDVDNVGVVSGNAVSAQGISLTGLWYPRIEGLANFRLRATLPEGFVAVSEADEVGVSDTTKGTVYSFIFKRPIDSLNMAAGKYRVLKDSLGDTELYAYFFEEDFHLAEEYLRYTREYLQMYEEMLGPYPFKRFSVVENSQPTGYSMPTYTMLGRDVVSLPFIVETSLGHEILHQWFGNSVYADTSEGNWHEGLTTYLADHLYAVLRGEGTEYRKKILADYQSYVTKDKEMALRDFRGRVDQATRSVGYGKGAMVFHMLAGLVGQDDFLLSLRNFIGANMFKSASWSDIRKAFEETTGRDLGWFFSQWTEREGVPQLRIDEPRAVYIKGKPAISLKLRQLAGPYRLDVKYRVRTTAGTFNASIETSDEAIDVRQEMPGTPLEVELDPEYDIMRTLAEPEFPPSVSRLMGDERRIIVPAREDAATYARLIRMYADEGFEIIPHNEITDEDIGSASLLLLGNDGKVHMRLFGEAALVPDEGFSLEVRKNPLNPSKVVAIAIASAPQEVWPAARKLFRYGKYSYLFFEAGANKVKEIDESENGIIVNLRHTVEAVKLQSAVSLDTVIVEIIDKPIIYIGESHTNYEDHRVQLEVIRSLHEKNREFAVGMEMFQKQFQGALDDYIGGKTTEKEFLKASEYFSRWKFDYRLYREILAYARAHGIPVLALNMDSAIIKKVAKGGLDSLSEEEKQEVPADMDMADYAYRERLKRVFDLHDRPEGRSFQNFYQSQILWDETMAHSLNGYLAENPGHQAVVLSGVGHVAYGSGIPQRAHRLNDLDYTIMINSSDDSITEGMADYILFPQEIDLPPAPKLGVVLEKTDTGLLIKRLAKGGPAESAGIREDDILSSVDGVRIDDIVDVKVALLERSEGDKMKVRVLRKRFLGKRKEMEFTVTLKAQEGNGSRPGP